MKKNTAVPPVQAGVQLLTIDASMHPDIISSFWTMLRECEAKAETEGASGLLRLWVEGWYRQWNDMTGDDKGPRWLLTIESPKDRAIVDEFRAALIGGPKALLSLDDKIKAEAAGRKRRMSIAVDTSTPFFANTLERVKNLVGEQLGISIETIRLENTFVRDLGADSLDSIELVMALEDEFSLEIPDEDCETMQTVQHAVVYVVRELIERGDIPPTPPAYTMSTTRAPK